MSTDTSGRRFARFAPTGSPSDGYFGLPEDGLCLSVFVVVSPPGESRRALLGKIDPAGPWHEIGALNPERARSTAGRWMLPSSQLVFFESPDDAARRILREQLGAPELPVGAPRVFSETYQSRRHPEQTHHWDLHFVYRAEWPSSDPPHHAAWRELAFLDPARVARSEFARSHEEILELAGFRIG
ncbi:MAG TPA: NUDIX hydrolase [Thermoplasmata archaeon]|nr:NUDIX hydrolase [Thermoplasmata archaeon]